MDTLAVVFEAPKQLELRTLELTPAEGEVLVDVEFSGISTGTERLLWSGHMPAFPGLGYPLVPGYESVGTVLESPDDTQLRPGDRVFVPGASCYGPVRGLFGGTAQRLHAPAKRLTRLPDMVRGPEGILLALAATAQHALAGGPLPDLIVGHGVLGRLLARLAVAAGGNPVVWEKNPVRRAGGDRYAVIDPANDPRKDYRVICDVSGDTSLIEPLIGRLAKGGELVLAGFYSEPISFAFPPAFMREARLRVAAEWAAADLNLVTRLLDGGQLKLDGLITHHRAADRASEAYDIAFHDPTCLKMCLDWRPRP